MKRIALVIALLFTCCACSIFAYTVVELAPPATKAVTLHSQEVASVPTMLPQLSAPTDALVTHTLISTATPVVQQLCLGDTVEQYGYSLSAISVEDPAVPNEWFSSLEAGDKMVAIEIILENISGEPLSVNPLDTTLVDKNGFTYSVELGGSVHEQIDCISLFIGEKIRGWVAFEIPQDAIPATIKFEVDWFSDEVLQASLLVCEPPQ